MAWHLAPSLVKLQADLDAEFGDDRPGDGTIGDEAHAARDSEHNPDHDSDPMPEGAVSAIDVYSEAKGKVWISDAQFERFLAVLKKDSRVWYVIHKGHIWSRTHDFEKREYDGSNPHNTHIHISLVQTKAAHDSKVSWKIKGIKAGPPPKAPVDTRKKLPVLNLGDKHDYLVPVLKRFFGGPGAEQGPIFNQGLTNTVKSYQRSQGLTRDGVVGPATWGVILKSLTLPGWKL